MWFEVGSVHSVAGGALRLDVWVGGAEGGLLSGWQAYTMLMVDMLLGGSRT